LFVELLKEMSECPCGLTREEVKELKMFGPGALCTALDADNNPCGKRLADHPHQQSGRYFFSKHFDFSFS
jgi:hypothetical protein